MRMLTVVDEGAKFLNDIRLVRQGRIMYEGKREYQETIMSSICGLLDLIHLLLCQITKPVGLEVLLQAPFFRGGRHCNQPLRLEPFEQNLVC